MPELVTVLMAVHNGEPYLRPCIESILNQTYPDFIFLIVDDASTDRSKEIIRSYNDPRIKLVPLEKNVGQTAALNVGLRQIKTPWVARMDADDYSAPTRLAEQLKMVTDDPSLCCVGAFAWIFVANPCVVEQLLTRPTTDVDIKRALLKQPSIIHGSLLVNRKDLVEAGAYNEHYRYAADFEMYDRLLTKDRRAANIPKPLLGIRRHPNQDSRSLTAINEGIEIYSNRLATSLYSRKERTVIREALSFFYLLRIRYQISFGKFGKESMGDIIKAFTSSPKTAIRFFPEGIMGVLKKITK